MTYEAMPPSTVTASDSMPARLDIVPKLGTFDREQTGTGQVVEEMLSKYGAATMIKRICGIAGGSNGVRAGVDAGRAVAGLALVAACLIMAPGCGPKEQKLSPAAEHFVAARKALETGDKTTALTELDAAIAAGADVWMYVERAKLHAAEGRDDQAKADVEAGLKLDPENGDLKWLEKELKKSKNRRFQGAAAEPPRSAK